MLHGNRLFVSSPAIPTDRPMHFNGCPHHKLSFDSQTLAFLCPISKQEQATRLSISGNFAHIADNFVDEDEKVLQSLIGHGRGNIVLDRADKPLRSIDGRSDEKPNRRERATGTGEKFGEGDNLTEMFEGLTAAGFDVKLLQIGDDVIGLAAMGDSIDLRPDLVLAEDPGFIGDKPHRRHTVGVTIESEVAFDPVHFPTFSAYVLALASGYCRMVALNVEQGIFDPTAAKIYLTDLNEFIQLAERQRNSEAALTWLETPMLAKLPSEEGGRPA